MWSLREPSPDRIRTFLEEQEGTEPSYPDVGRTARFGDEGAPPGYDLDHERTLLGHGRGAFEAAREAVRCWTMFPAGWTRVVDREGRGAPAIAEGTTVAMLVRAWGLWWWNACRVVWTVEGDRPREDGEPARFGFAYGTLPAHVERGEERFVVEWRADDTVWYDLHAFSRPRAWSARIGYPVVRRLQARFRADSLEAMRRAVTRGVPPGEGG